MIASLLAKVRTAHLRRRSHKRHRFSRSCSEELQVPASSYLTHWRYITLDLRKLTILHEAHKLSSCLMVFVLPPEKFSQTSSGGGTAVAQWLRCCATNLKIAGTIPGGVIGFFIDIKFFRSHYGPGVDSASNRNEYQEYFLGVKAAGS